MKRLRARRTSIIKMLSDLARNGWANATAADWHPLEAELDRINRQLDGK